MHASRITSVWVLGLLSLSLTLGATSARAGTRIDDSDPENGQFRLLSLTSRVDRDSVRVNGTLRATDDRGATGDREFRIDASGDVARGTRRVTLHRYDDDCARLAGLARQNVDGFCDQIALTQSADRLGIAFSSFDANRRYSFELTQDPRSPGQWQSVAPRDREAPILLLSLTNVGGGASVRWYLRGHYGEYSRAGEIDAETLRASGLSAIEASLIPLADTLRAFNSFEFQFADLPREHPLHEATPYALWAEQPVEGGCIFIICFGNLGGGGGGGGSQNNDPCDPASPAYDPSQCPWDLTRATWPISQRVKIWKISDDEVGYSFFYKNEGKGIFNADEAIDEVEPAGRMSFVSLLHTGETLPLSRPIEPSQYYGLNQCYYEEFTIALGVVDPFDNLTVFGLLPGQSWPTAHNRLICPKASGRPSGRYRLWLKIDPDFVYDSVGFEFNNTSTSGPVDWVNLRH